MDVGFWEKLFKRRPFNFFRTSKAPALTLIKFKKASKIFLTATAELRTFGVADVITEEMHCFVIFVIGNQRGSIFADGF
jgi:hypothetical protein